jgi:fructose 1,6-bisphosphatase
MRGSHQMPLMPVKQNSTISYFDGPPVVSCAAFSVHERRLSEPVDVFDHPFWDAVRHRVAEKSVEMRRQGGRREGWSLGAVADSDCATDKKERTVLALMHLGLVVTGPGTG